ncbi:radical SAM protein [Neolewinella lacunae]|uniref:Radical SAM protein n=1 Tax=Neolewinella lacunae TaxID=1517758 RepID=A0A923PR10_9BACT|nr:radical SAM protein [Neolewinella lacunae]MBC6995167.1 radical SAM protein [Neolewinella lacunae]MDN3634117.1 radical SAM protein [Neolewinella lacunae]
MPAGRYTYYDFTLSLCPHCLRRVEAKIVFEDDKVWMRKRCPEHGLQRVMIATDVEYYKQIRNYNKASEYPNRFHTPVQWGCPFDCGLCADHEQHSCLTVLEITDRCNLSCPTCYAESSPTHGSHRTLAEVERMLDAIVASEGEPDVVQISGGEPTIHPDFWAIMDMAKARPIKHLMLNTNGLRIANDPGFAERLATYLPDFEVYLQFDSFRPSVLMSMRGQDLTRVRERALARLNAVDLSTTLVCTLQRGQNEDELGEIIRYALEEPCVRGVTFQPTQVAGRTDNFNPATDRLTPTEVRQRILDQTPLLQPNDLIPVPCNPDALTMGYLLKLDGQVFPLTRYINPAALLDTSRPNTIVYEQQEDLHRHVLDLFSTGCSVDTAQENFHQLMCCLPPVSAPSLGYGNLFRIIIMHFMDAYDFDVRSVKKSCVHIVEPNGHIIPFETMNMFYRSAVQRANLASIRAQIPSFSQSPSL